MPEWSFQRKLATGAILVCALTIVTSVLSLVVTPSLIDRDKSLLLMIAVANIVLLMLLCGAISVTLTRSYHQQTAARELAERSRTQATEALASVLHDLRGPLAPMLTWTQLLQSGSLNPEKTARGLEVIERNIGALTQLLNERAGVIAGDPERPRK